MPFAKNLDPDKKSHRQNDSISSGLALKSEQRQNRMALPIQSCLVAYR